MQLGLNQKKVISAIAGLVLLSCSYLVLANTPGLVKGAVITSPEQEIIRTDLKKLLDEIKSFEKLYNGYATISSAPIIDKDQLSELSNKLNKKKQSLEMISLESDESQELKSICLLFLNNLQEVDSLFHQYLENNDPEKHKVAIEKLKIKYMFT